MKHAQRRLMSNSALAGASLAVAFSACSGGAWEEQDPYLHLDHRPSTGESRPHSSSSSMTFQPVAPECIQSAEWLDGYQYVGEGTFWLGSQEEENRSVSGLGYFVALGAEEDEPQYRFERELLWSVGQDGALRDQRAYPLLVQTSDANCPRRVMAPLGILPRATSQLSVRVNLDSSSEVIRTHFREKEPAASSNFETQFRAYDNLGTAHTLEIYFRKSADNQWEYHTVADGAELAGGTPGTFKEVGKGELVFDTNGALKLHTVEPVLVDFAGGARPGQEIDYDFGQSIAEGGNGLWGATGFSSRSAVSEQVADGYPRGTATRVYLGSDGTFTVFFDNDQSVAIGRVLMARFADEHALLAAKDGSLRESADSGARLFGAPETSGFGSVR